MGYSQSGGKGPSKRMHSVKNLSYGIATLAPKEPQDLLIMPSSVIPKSGILFSSFFHSFAFITFERLLRMYV